MEREVVENVYDSLSPLVDSRERGYQESNYIEHYVQMYISYLTW